MIDSRDTSAAPASASASASGGAPRGRPVVLQVIPRLETGGAERTAVDVAAALARAGGTAIVASEGGRMEHELARAGALHVTLPLASKNPLVMRRNAARLARLIRQHEVDIIHARSRAPAWSAAAAARRTGCRFVTTFHGTYGAKSALKRWYNSIMIRGERVIANSDFIAGHIRGAYRIDDARLRVIPRGVDLERFDPSRVGGERVAALARAWRLDDGVPLILLPGRLTRWKGQGLLLDALATMAERDFLCVLVGADQGRAGYRRELEQRTASLGLSGRVFILDECRDMPAAYMLADVVVSASTDPEAFGRIVGEAQAMGCPVAAPRHGGAPEQVIEDRTAFLFTPGDAAGLAAAIGHALDLNSSSRETLAREAMANVRAKFSKDGMCGRTLGLYRELLRADAYRPAAAAYAS